VREASQPRLSVCRDRLERTRSVSRIGALAPGRLPKLALPVHLGRFRLLEERHVLAKRDWDLVAPAQPYDGADPGDTVATMHPATISDGIPYLGPETHDRLIIRHNATTPRIYTTSATLSERRKEGNAAAISRQAPNIGFPPIADARRSGSLWRPALCARRLFPAPHEGAFSEQEPVPQSGDGTSFRSAATVRG
jgi:hypothetical protein